MTFEDAYMPAVDVLFHAALTFRLSHTTPATSANQNPTIQSMTVARVCNLMDHRITLPQQGWGRGDPFDLEHRAASFSTR